MPNIKVRLLVSINRQSSLESAQESLALVKEIESPFIVGVELSGDPRQGKFATFEDELQAFRLETGKKVSLHCAEVEEQMAEAQEMIDFGPDRLGHCSYLVSPQIAFHQFSRLLNNFKRLRAKAFLLKCALLATWLVSPTPSKRPSACPTCRSCTVWTTTSSFAQTTQVSALSTS